MPLIKLCSLNVNGLRDHKKCQTVLTYLTSKCKGVIMLQETHTSVIDEKTWSDITGAECYFSHGTTDSRGVAIMIPKSLNATVKNVVPDNEGRFLLIDVMINNTSYIILNIYAPTKDKAKQQVNFLGY